MYDLFSSNYVDGLLGSYVTCIFTMTYYMSLCKITYFKTAAWICFKVFVDISCMDPYQDCQNCIDGKTVVKI